MAALVGDVDYQYRLRADFRRRRVHPTIEALVWAPVVGKPAERVLLSADVSMSQKLDQERELFFNLDIQQLEALAAESQALVDRAMEMAKANALRAGAATARRAPVEKGDGSDARDSKYIGTDVARSGDGNRPFNADRVVAALPSTAVGVEDVAKGGPAEKSIGTDVDKA
jgi:hypothetical protein